MNFFGVDASLPLSHWQKKGWIYHEDPRGWFQWYCRYYMDRRLQGDWDCRPKQRQALPHWAYDSRKY